jgi:hypothetical protein
MQPDADFRKLLVRDGVALTLTQVFLCFGIPLIRLMTALPGHILMSLCSDAAARRNGD